MTRNGSIDDDHNFYDKNSYQTNFLFLENKFFFSFFAFMNSTHLFLDVHGSSEAKIFRFSSTAGASF